MAKSNVGAAPSILKEIREVLEERVDEKARAAASRAAASKGPVKLLGVRPAAIRLVAKEMAAKHRNTLDRETAVALVEGAAARKTREEILVAIELLERFRRELTPAFLTQIDKWSGLAEDLDIAEALGTKLGAPALALDTNKLAMVRKWARMKSVGRRRLALLTAWALVTEGKREANAALEICELLLNEEHPVLVAGVAALLRETTKVDAKAVQDFLFRRSVDGNPDILRAGSENLDSARRAALIAKLEAQAGIVPVAVASR